jgi:fibronectin type 3 domain-containing protein
VGAATVTGAGFTLSAATFPVTLTSGQMLTLSVEFDPTSAGAATGQLTITSTSSTNSTAAIALTGTGTTTSYVVDLSWDAPSGSADPIAGYNIYRSTGSNSTYELLNSSADTETNYVDSKVQNGLSYDYVIESVDDSGVESAPSSKVIVTIP